MPLTLTRSLLTILLPGFVAIAPWLFLGVIGHEEILNWYKEYKTPIHAASFALAVVVGSFFEGLAGYIEKSWDELIAKDEMPSLQTEDWVTRDWYEYLMRRHGDAEPVAYRYISRKVTSLYFYYGMMMSAPLALLGWSKVFLTVCPDKFWIGLVFAVIGIGAFWIFRWFALSDHEVLCYSRRYLSEAFSVKYSYRQIPTSSQLRAQSLFTFVRE